MIKPTIGRVVWYRDPESDQPCDAHIVYVHSDEKVNLAVFSREGHLFSRLDVPLFQGPSEACPEGQACWMPYQQTQAASGAKPSAHEQLPKEQEAKLKAESDAALLAKVREGEEKAKSEESKPPQGK